MNVKAIVIIAVIALLSFIGFNTYQSAQYKKAINERQAKTAEVVAQSVSKPVIKDAEPIAEPAAEVSKTKASGAAVAVASDDVLFNNTVDKHTPEPTNKLDNSFCSSVIPVAEKVMRARQDGIAISNSLDFADRIKDGTPANDAVSRITNQMVVEAYKQPYFSTLEYQNKAVTEFGSRQYLACMDAFK